MKKAGMTRSQRKLARMAAGVTADYLYPGSGKYVKALVGRKRKKNAKSKRRKNNLAGGYTRQSEAIPAAEGDVIHHSPKKHTFVIEEEELITTIFGNTSATPVSHSYRINPREPATFPWLSGLGLAFETYKFTKLEFRFDPSCGTAERGTVTMGIDYQPSDTGLSTEAEVMVIPGSATGPVYRKISVAAVAGGRSLLYKEQYLGVNLTDAEADIGNLGTFYLLVTGTTSGASVIEGRLFVKYRVELSIQQINATGALRGRGWYGSWNDASSSDAFVYGGNSGVAPVVSTSSDAIMGFAGTAGVKFLIPGPYLIITYFESQCTADTAGAGVNATFITAPTGAIQLFQYGIDMVLANATQAAGPGWVVRLAYVYAPNATLQLDILTSNVTDVDLGTLSIIPIPTAALLIGPEDTFEASFKAYKEKKRLIKERRASKVERKKTSTSPDKKSGAVSDSCEETKSVPGDCGSFVFEKKRRVKITPDQSTSC